jgi:integration host factor subunit alpha
MTLTKNELIERIRNENGFSKAKSTRIVETLLELMKGSLAAGDEVLVSGFGKFCVQQKAARRGRNPATGQELILPARKVVTFKCSSKLKTRLNR